MGTYVHTQHDDFDDVVGQGQIPIIHDQHIVLSEARLALDVGLTETFGASLMVPVRLVSTTIDYRDGKGNIVQLTSPSIHHRDETLTGLGDPMLLGSYARRMLTLRAGVSIPLGKTEEDPFALGAMGLPHEHIQMGTGTINPVVSAELSLPWKKWQFGGYALTQQIVYENAKGYQAGDRYALGVGARRGFAGNWLARAGVDMQAESSERWQGELHPEEGNQGRIDVMLSLGASWAVSDRLSLDTALKIPFITHVVGGQLDMPALLEVGVAWRFGAAREDEHEHDHEHGHDHDHDDGDDHDHDDGDDHAHDDQHEHVDSGGADVVDLQPPGAAIDLAPVPGKLTIFEFGASWCEPCKTLEPVLVELAKAHPNVAVRRIDVVDWDSPVVARYLTPRAFDLPHVKVFDASGKLVFERSSAPGKLGALIDDVRALIEPPPPTDEPPAEAPVKSQSEPLPTKPKPAVKPYRVEIVVTQKGFEPAEVKVPHGRPVTLVITRKTDKTCAQDIVIEGQVKDLPLDKPVEIQLSFAKPGTVTYACGMNMIKGTLLVQ
jgi:thiol-disulfide isomerase/thioredoxin/plastocyanin